MRTAHLYSIAFLSVFFTTAFSGCLPFEGCGTSHGKVVAIAGGREIYEKDVVLRQKVIVSYFPQETRPLALDQLIKYYSMAEVLKNLGRPVTKELLDAEALRIDQNTKNPKHLAELKGIFGSHSERYLHLFVLPVHVERVLYHEIFLQNKTLQKQDYFQWIEKELAKVQVTRR